MEKRVLIIIPAYNEQESILAVVNNLVKVCPKYDYIVVNDGSRDNTAKICREHHLNLLDLPINLGLSGAFAAGMKYAKAKGYDMALQFDADGQHLPDYIEEMVDEMGNGHYDLVIGSRFVNEKKPKSARMLGSNMISFAIKLTTGKKISDPTSGMRLWSKRLIEEFANEINITPEPDTVSYLIKSKAQVQEVQVKMEERMAGESYLNLSRSIQYMSSTLISILLVQLFRKPIILGTED